LSANPQRQPERDIASLVADLALPIRAGHYDELRAAGGALRAHWASFFGALGEEGVADLDRRAATVTRRIHDDGITYNVYSDSGGPQHPWSLDLVPFVVDADEWARIEAGVTQRAEVLSAVLADVYGERRLLADGLLPPALVLGHPGYLRSLAGVTPAGGRALYVVAFDLARGPDGAWTVVSQRTQAPSGMGYALQNRLIVSRLFPEVFHAMRIQRLASSYRRLLDTLYALSPRDGGETPRIVLLTPGPYNETYFEQVYLARYLGIALVEGSDLTVRDDAVYLKTLHGLERVHAILRRLDDDFCDPLELRPDSALGVPGLLQAVRAGRVAMANALGSRFLESPALNGFLPAIARRVLHADLVLPALDSWWCGERSAYAQVAERLDTLVIKPTYPTAARPIPDPSMLGAEASKALEELRRHIDADPDAYTAQKYLPFSQTPTWQAGAIVPRSVMLRVYALADGSNGWHVMPGGLTRIASFGQRTVSMQRGGASADTWVQTGGPVDTFSMLPAPVRPEDLAIKRRPVTSRAAENLFWMGRYAERADHSVRLARTTLTLLGEGAQAPAVVLQAVGELCEQQGLVPPGTPSPAQSAPVFERTLIATLAGRGDVGGIAFNLGALARAGSQIRDRLSLEHWRLIVGAETMLRSAWAADQPVPRLADDALALLARLAVQIAAITGAQTDRLTRDDGWRLLTIGRQLERLEALAGALTVLFESGAIAHEGGFDLALSMFDSSITYRALYQRRFELPPLLDLLVREPANPRSLACVAGALRTELAALPGAQASGLLAHVSPPELWPSLSVLCTHDDAGRPAELLNLVDALGAGSLALSDAIGARFFSHAGTYRALNL
jgi:uncharacterized circularly permuted ATP-grasp superfamily protein/uncharacterized alpha-E superfamily protein